jgi:hypothetical protein
MKYEQPLINVLGSAQNTVHYYGTHSKSSGSCKDAGAGSLSSTGAYEVDE